MAKKINAVLSELGISSETTTEEMIEILSRNNTINTDEINNIINISVKPLPNVVKNNPDYVKQKMYGIVTDDNYGFASVFNKRVALLSNLIGKIKTKIDELDVKIENDDYYVGDEEPDASVDFWFDTSDAEVAGIEPIMMMTLRHRTSNGAEELTFNEDTGEELTFNPSDENEELTFNSE